MTIITILSVCTYKILCHCFYVLSFLKMCVTYLNKRESLLGTCWGHIFVVSFRALAGRPV